MKRNKNREREVKELVKKVIMTSSLSPRVPNVTLNHIFHSLERGFSGVKRFGKPVVMWKSTTYKT